MSSLAECLLCLTRYAGDLERCPNCGCGDRTAEGGSRLPSADVVCRSEGCLAAGTSRRVYLRVAVPGVLELPQLLLCACCGMAMHMERLVVGGHVIEEEHMPKITRHGGATNASDGGELAVDGQEEGGEDLSAGNSSSTSPPKPPQSDGPTETPLPKRARSAGSRSKQAPEASSTADSTAGSGSTEATD